MLPRFTGILVGLVLAGSALLLAGRMRSPSAQGPIISECDGAIRSIVIQYVPDADFAAAVYRQFLPQLPPQVTVYAICPQQAAYDQLLAQVGPTRCRIRPVIVGHAMTAWSRDRWISRRGPDGRLCLLSPRGELGADAWPARLGDQQLASDLARAMPEKVSAQRSDLFFDGGDFLADEFNVFVGPSVTLRNVQHTVEDVAELKAALARALKRNVVLLDNAPDHHVGMYMASVGNKTALVGDPSLARGFAHAELPGSADFSPQTQQRYDSVARQLRALGYRVARIPLIPSTDGRTFFTYVNDLIDVRPGPAQRIVYMPTYRGCQAMNAAAESIWTSLGYQVRPIDCTSTYRLFGNLHCLVNVLDR